MVVSACERSGRNRVPELAPLQSLQSWCREIRAERKLALYPDATQSIGGAGAARSVALLVSPEGGLSETELEHVRRAGFDPVALGPRVLRTETAPLAAIAVLQYQWGDLSG